MWRRARPPGATEWAFEPQGWDTEDPLLKGWNVDAVARAEAERWAPFLATLSGPGPVGVSHEETLPVRDDVCAHNTIMCFAYVLARAAGHRDAMAMLDWGGGVGHYYQIGRTLFPGLRLDYTCKELPAMARTGRELQPALRFVDSETAAFDRPYELVMASSSLHYARDWTRLLRTLAGAARGHLYVTRLPLIERNDSFVVRQRAYAYGYDTEYLGWCLNRGEFLDAAASANMRLEREFLIDEDFPVPGAPEPIGCRGFLFCPA